METTSYAIVRMKNHIKYSAPNCTGKHFSHNSNILLNCSFTLEVFLDVLSIDRLYWLIFFQVKAHEVFNHSMLEHFSCIYILSMTFGVPN